ncbi:hypothetical protein COLO4_26073 [Corchorus olitorius]|uniref:Uncharacterized protein n=1 Tax=Corchorus olitorius TaxID=93759 RepID=A0A1R3HYM9_9ROSI|nr:hypothetical protein COLO4_26073 [Corchorus olitorius]
MVRLWLSPDEVLYWEFQILSQVTGLTLCEETIPNLLELVFKVDPLGVKDGELAESRKEKDLMLEDQKSEKGEVKDDLLDDQDWEQVDSSSIYEEAHQNGR